MDFFFAVASPKADGGDDVVAVHPLEDDAQLLVLADGATGVGHGRQAAQRFVAQCLAQVARFPANDDDLVRLFWQADAEIQRSGYDCDTTGVLVAVHGRDYVCAAVGDSGAWLLLQDEVFELTRGQRRKPRIGSGCFSPLIVRGQLPVGAGLLLGSDGLGYALPMAQAADLARQAHSPAEAIVQAARSQNRHGLPDDLGVIVGR